MSKHVQKKGITGYVKQIENEGKRGINMDKSWGEQGKRSTKILDMGNKTNTIPTW